MFIAIALSILAFIGFLSFRDWIHYQRLTPKDVERILTRVSKLILLEEWQQAKKEIAPLIAHQLGSKETELLYIQVLRGTKAYEKAIAIAKEGYRNFPEELLFRVEEGKTLLEMGLPEKALEALQASETILRKTSDLLDLAVAYLRAGFAEKAWEIVEPRVAANPSGILLATAGECLLELKQPQPALEMFEKAIEKGWDSHHLQNQLGHTQRLLGNFKTAELIYRKILEKDSSDIAATLGLGACMQDRGFYQKALLIYQSGAAWEKRDLRILMQAALMALYSHRYTHAEQYFGEVIDRKGPTEELLSYYGYVLEQQQKWQEAEEVYTEQAKLFPKALHASRALAWLFGCGLTTSLSQEDGLGFANRTLELAPDALSYEILSACEARVGNFEAAYQIQEYLATKDQTQSEKIRRQTLLKTLRKNLPLDNQHILRRLVA